MLKLTITNSWLLLIAILMSIACVSCNEQSPVGNNQKQHFEIPKLLDRSEHIQLGKEWDYVQNFYSEQRDKYVNDKKHHEALLNIAQLFVKEARVTGEHGHYYPAALSLTNKIINENKENTDLLFRALTTQAGVQLSLHEFEPALATGMKAIELNAENAQIYGVLVDAHVELGQYKKAIELADRMIAIKPDLRSYARVSYLREIHGDVSGAIAAMEMAVKSGFPGYEETAWAMATLGDLYNTYGRTDAARKAYEAILEDRPNYPFALAALADLQYTKGDLEMAEKTLNNAINIIPEVGYYVQLAKIYKDENRQEEFDAIMTEIFEMLADDELAGHNMNMEYAHIFLDILHEPDQALDYVKKEYEKRPNNIDVNRLLAKIYIIQNKNEYADEHFILASATNSKHPELMRIASQL